MAYSSSTLYNGLFIVNGNVLMGNNVASNSPITYPAGSTRLIYSGDDFSNTRSQYYTGTHLQLQAQSVTSQQGKAWGGSLFLEGGKETPGGSNTHGSIQFLTGGFEAMRVASNGYVGINVSTPMYNLDVKGTTNIFNQLTVSSIYVRNNIVVSTNITSFNLNTNGSMTSGSNVVATNDVIAFGNITASGVITGNGSGLTNVPSAGFAANSGYAESAGSAPYNSNVPLTLTNMSIPAPATLQVGGQIYYTNDVSYYDWTGAAHYATNQHIVAGTNFTPAISVFADTGTQWLFAVAQGTGGVVSKGTYGSISDSNLKDNIVASRDYTEDLCKLNVVKFNFKDPDFVPLISTIVESVPFYDSSGNLEFMSTISRDLAITHPPKELGFLAQDVQKVFPSLVNYHFMTDQSTGIVTSTLSIKTSVFLPMAITSIQSLKARLDLQESTIQGMTTTLSSIKAFLSTSE